MKYWQERREVLEAAKEILARGLVVGTWGNVSTRVKDESFMVITPSGKDYETLTIEDMVVVNWEHNVLEGELKPSVETSLHVEIYKKRPDINAVVHVHSPWATAFAVAGKNIPVILEETAQVIGHEVEIAPYAPCGSSQLAKNAVQALEDGKVAVLLANHGLVGLGKDTASALRVCHIAERTAMITVYANALGPVKGLELEDIEFLHQSFKYYGQERRE